MSTPTQTAELAAACKPILTTGEVCAEFGISRQALLRLVAAKKIAGRRFGREYKFLRRIIENYLAGESPSPAPSASAPQLRPLPVVPRTIRR